MAMVVHPRDEGEKKFLEGFYRGLKTLGFSKLGYAKKQLVIKGDGYTINIQPGDLIALATDNYEASCLFAIYREVVQNPQNYISLPDFKYIDRETIALAKIRDRVIKLVTSAKLASGQKF